MPQNSVLRPWHLLVVSLAALMNKEQQRLIEYLQTENKVLKEIHGGKRILLNDKQRLRLAVKGKVLGRKRLQAIATLFSPDTILRWHRRLVAKKWDYSSRRKRIGRPEVSEEVVRLVLPFAGCTPNPDDAWMKQVARNLTESEAGFLGSCNHLLMDRDTKFSESFRHILETADVEPVVLPPRSPNLNAHIERFMKSVKHECLNRLIFFGDGQLRNAVS